MLRLVLWEVSGRVVNLERYAKTEYAGKITDVREGTLRELLEAKGLEEDSILKWTKHDKAGEVSKLDRMHIQPVADYEGAAVNGPYLMVPATAGGYHKSNMKDFIDGNGLPYDTSKWLNSKVKLVTANDGFLRFAL
jgi:hypothetical protein